MVHGSNSGVGGGEGPRVSQRKTAAKQFALSMQMYFSGEAAIARVLTSTTDMTWMRPHRKDP